MIWYAFLFALIGCFFGMLTAGSGAAATVGDVLKKIQNLPAAQRRATLEEGAKSEGQVVFYTSVSSNRLSKNFGSLRASVSDHQN